MFPLGKLKNMLCYYMYLPWLRDLLALLTAALCWRSVDTARLVAARQA